jgi:type I restriction enzyme M protein
VIIPEGVLFNSGKAYKRTREMILKDCDLHSVISLPSGVFNPYTAVKTSILIFTKKEFDSIVYHTKKVWFYGMESDGYTLDTNRKKINGDFPLPLVRDKYKNRNEEPQTDRKKIHFAVPISKIVENGLELNYNLYKEYVYEEQNYEEPSKLIELLEKLNNEATKGLNNLIKDFK